MFEKILEKVFDNLTSAINEELKKKGTDKKLEAGFLECADFISNHEKTDEKQEAFEDVIAAAFSKENMLRIYRGLNKETGYTYINKLKLSLKKLCEEYQIDGEYFSEQFVKMFKRCIYENDRMLALEIFTEDFREEVNTKLVCIQSNTAEIAMIGKEVYDIKNILLSSGLFSDSKVQIPLLTTDKAVITGEEEELLKWELHYPERNGESQSYREKMLHLTDLWKKEREAVPGWYIIPENKREVLRLYTRGSELIYQEENISFTELFAFTYELIWRYEASFMTYPAFMQKRLQEIWEQAGKTEHFLETKEIRGKYFFIGQVLLRIYRENLQEQECLLVCKETEKYADAVANGKDQLYLEKIKYSFMQMKITDTCMMLNNAHPDREACGVRMQIAGLKAECGMLEEAEKDLKALEMELEAKINEEKLQKENLERVYHCSVLAECYFLHRFICQAKKPFGENLYVEKLTKKVEQYQIYFNYEAEHSAFRRKQLREQQRMQKAVAFELHKVIKTVFGGKAESSSYEFYRMLDRAALPLHIRYVRLLENDESEFISDLIAQNTYIGWYMLLRFGSTDTTKRTVTRWKCIELNGTDGKKTRAVFFYVYEAVDRTISSMQGKDDDFSGNAYGHTLENGMEILCRLVSTATITEQKKLVTLMLKLIEADVVRTYQVLNRWIEQVMRVFDERVKISALNELLQCSTRKRTTWAEEKELDPFDVFSWKVLAEKSYKQVDIEPGLVNDMLEQSMQNEQNRMHYIPRLGQLAEWSMLTPEQEKRFGEILWKDVEEGGFPMGDTYYLNTFLGWPRPEDINVETRIKRVILSEKAFQKVRDESLITIMPCERRLLQEIRAVNNKCKDFWTVGELEFLIKELFGCWISLKKAYDVSTHKSFFEDEFENQARALVNVLASFERKAVQSVPEQEKTVILQMAEEMETYNISCTELYTLVCTGDELKNIVESIMEGCRSVDEDVETSAIGAARLLLLTSDDEEYKEYTEQICDELMELCRYRKEPGLDDFLIALHNCLYMYKLKLNETSRNRLSKTLCDLAVVTDYAKWPDASENKIKEIITIRKHSADVAFQLYLYEEKENLEHCEGSLIWKEICRGEKSCVEFQEVRAGWV